MNTGDLAYEYESAFSYVRSIGKNNISEVHLNEWKLKLSLERDTLKRRFINIHIVVITNILNAAGNELVLNQYFQ
jgi:hypothetical protein